MPPKPAGPASAPSVQIERCRQQVSGVVRFRRGEDFFAGPLFHDLALLHHHHAMRQGPHDPQIVADKDIYEAGRKDLLPAMSAAEADFPGRDCS